MSRAWVIGSGSSLKDTPLHLLKDETTYAMNRIHLMYDDTDWRPSYFYMADHNANLPTGYWKEYVRQHRDTPKYLWKEFRDGSREVGEGIGEVPNTTWIDRCKKHHFYMADNYMRRAQSWHLPDLCTAFNSVGAVMQLAVKNGASVIYLLGCDLYTDKREENHFVPDYTKGWNRDVEEYNKRLVYMHKVAKRSSPIPIYNATIGGQLEVHKRVNVLEVLGEEKMLPDNRSRE